MNPAPYSLGFEAAHSLPLPVTLPRTPVLLPCAPSCSSWCAESTPEASRQGRAAPARQRRAPCARGREGRQPLRARQGWGRNPCARRQGGATGPTRAAGRGAQPLRTATGRGARPCARQGEAPPLRIPLRPQVTSRPLLDVNHLGRTVSHHRRTDICQISIPYYIDLVCCC